ncbi:MAG TPA: MFS transporter [Firmicutes bacterium]|nr:MFS transporter [Bacillota bacterium]
MVHLLIAVIYLSFISLGLPDGLLGAAWPSIYPQLQVPVSYAGVISMIIAAGTIVSSLMSERLTRKLGSGGVTALSVATTAVALFGFSISDSFVALCLWGIPYGLGAGSVDAALNNFVALHYSSRHMSWLHCFWGVGCSAGPYIMAWCLTGGMGWNMGYRIVCLLQIVLTAILIFSLPLWKQKAASQTDTYSESGGETKPFGLLRALKLPGVIHVLLAFFCYSAIEQTAGLWAASYMVLARGVSAQEAANWASLFYLGITVGRFLSGFITTQLNDRQMIRLGQVICLVGVLLLFLPLGHTAALTALLLIGLGCAPIYPSFIHATPGNFGKEASPAVIGLQMACAYVGTCLMPPVFGLLADFISIQLLPVFLLVLLVLMILTAEGLNRRTAQQQK